MELFGLAPRLTVGVPVADYALTQGSIMTAIALAATAVGLVAFNRRDLVGA